MRVILLDGAWYPEFCGSNQAVFCQAGPRGWNVDLERGERAAAEPVMKSLLGFFFLFKTMTSVKPKIRREHLGEGGGWPVKLTLLNIWGTECGGSRLTFFLGYLRKSKRDAHSASWLSPPGTSLNGTDLVVTGCKNVRFVYNTGAPQGGPRRHIPHILGSCDKVLVGINEWMERELRK